MNICPNCLYRGREQTCPRDGYLMVSTEHFGTQDAPPNLIGKVFDQRYQIEGLIGIGAMGTVWRARHRITQQCVALKLIRRDGGADLQAARRFLREARACSRLSHPNTIRVYDFGYTKDGYLFMTMELLKGKDLRSILKEEGPLPPWRVVRVAEQVCEALDEAHAAGIVHRDLKPSNVFLAEVHLKEDYVKVIDFGIARTMLEDAGDQSLTGAGVLVGTPRYVSPEQAQGNPSDLRSDLYSLGVVLYETLTGSIPFSAPNTAALLVAHISEPPKPLPESVRGFILPASLRELIASLLAKDPAQRPQTAAAVIERLRDIEADVEWPESSGLSTGGRLLRRLVTPVPGAMTVPGRTPPSAPETPAARVSMAGTDSRPPGSSSSPEDAKSAVGIPSIPEAPAVAAPPSGPPELPAPAPAIPVQTGPRLRLLLGLTAAVCIVLIAVLVAILWPTRSPDSNGGAAPLDIRDAATFPDPGGPGTPAPDAGPPRTTVPEAPPPTPAPVPAAREIRIETVPAGATLGVDGPDGPKQLKAPARIPVPAGGVVTVTARAPGFQTARVKVAEDGPDPVVIRLRVVPVKIEIP